MSGISFIVEARDRNGGSVCQMHTSNRFPLRIVSGPSGRSVPYNGLAILVVEWEDAESLQEIHDYPELRALPEQMVSEVGMDGAIQMPAPTSPNLNSNSKRECWSVLRFRGSDGRFPKDAEGERDIERDSKSETAIGTWICRDAMLGPDLVASSLILLLCRSTEVHERHHVREFAARLRHYLDWYPERIAQMRDNPLFIYVILYQCYNSFYTLSHQFERVYRDVAASHEKSLYGIFGRCYQLNKGLISMSYCYPDVVMHKAALKKLAELNRGDPERPNTLHGLDLEFDKTLKDLEGDLEDFEAHLGRISDRFKSALDLEFNLSGERLNLIMMWFTGFTVLFTPITFVAAVFALTETDMAWFFIAGSITLVISIVICIWAYSSVVNLGQRVKSNQFRGLLHKLPYQEPGKRPPPSDDPDDGPRPPKPGRSSAHSRPMKSTYTRPSSYMPPPPPGMMGAMGGQGLGGFASSSSSSSDGGPGYRLGRTISYRRPIVASPRRRSEGGTMMYSRLRPPQSSSMQRPNVQHPNIIFTGPRTSTRPISKSKLNIPRPPSSRPSVPTATVRDYDDYIERKRTTHHPTKPPGPPPPSTGPIPGPSGTIHTGHVPSRPRSSSPSLSRSDSPPLPSPPPPAGGPSGPRHSHEQGSGKPQ